MNDQRDYFNTINHRYRIDKLIHTPIVQSLEMQDLEASLHNKPTGSMLDFGAGSGRVTFWFLQQGYNVTAVDISSHSLADIRTMYNKHKKPSWGTLQTKTALPRHTFFDIVVGADILHHVDIPTILPQLKNVLKPHGCIAFSEPNAYHIPWYVHYARQRIPWHIEQGILQCTYKNIYRQFIHAGFLNVHIKGHGLFPTPLLSPFSSLCKINALSLGNTVLSRGIAFRYIISATNG